ncbi:MAG: MFS transporter [Clostridiales bacterium]|nr:MFS transporter [Clostridiales bacterium]
MSTRAKKSKLPLAKGKVSLGNKLAFACGDIFGGGSFNIINFLFTPFLTLVVGIPMIYLTPILLLTKIWDGIIDPFIGNITDAKTPGRFGKRRFFMLICAPLVLVGFVLLFFPWSLVTTQIWAKCFLVVFVYMLYATAQSFVLIPYYSHASEMTDDFNERNNTNAVRLAFSIMSSLICVAVPGMVASPEKGPTSYIIMASAFGFIFMVSVLIAALFSREQVVTPAVKTKFDLKDFVRPLKMRTYRQYLGMQMCASFGMAVMSSFFFTLCDFFLRRTSYWAVSTGWGGATGRFPIATIAAAMMFLAQIIALPIYLKIIKVKSKRFAYITGAVVWIVVALFMLFLPEEGTAANGGISVGSSGSVTTVIGAPDWLLILFGLFLGLGIGGTVFVPHSSFGDVCDVGELYFGERTEGSFSGLTNFLNTTAQAIGLAIPPLIIGLTGYVETEYVTSEVFITKMGWTAEQFANCETTGIFSEMLKGFSVDYKYTVADTGIVQLMPISQPEPAQQAIKLTFILLPIIILILAIIIAANYKLTSQLQAKVVALNGSTDKGSDKFEEQRAELLTQLGETASKLPQVDWATLAENKAEEQATATATDEQVETSDASETQPSENE